MALRARMTPPGPEAATAVRPERRSAFRRRRRREHRIGPRGGIDCLTVLPAPRHIATHNDAAAGLTAALLRPETDRSVSTVRAAASLGSRPVEVRVIKEAVMASSTAVLVRYDDPVVLAERAAVAGFLAGYTGNTLVSYTTDLRLFATWCAERGIRLLGVKRAHLELFARQMEAEGRMRSTVARRLSTLASFYRYCHVEGVLRRNPAANVRRPKVDHESRTLGLDRNELGALLVQAGLGSARDHALISLLALNGLRISEALGADIAALDMDRGHRTLTILRKGGKHVTIPLALRTARALDLYIGERTVGPIFTTVEGRRMDRSAADRTVKRLARRAGITKRISPHSLRHSFITAALDAGVPLRDVQEAASHADPRTTMRYDRGRQSLDRHATYVVAAFLAGASRQA
jgi:site-specific recombinase XerD